MSGKTKIVVLKLKQLIYMGIGIAVLALLILFLVIASKDTKKAESADATEAIYYPGTYTTAMTIGGSNIELAVTVDETAILSIEMNHVDEMVSVMYPLMEPALEELTCQILADQSLDYVEYSEENLYTSTVLLNAITASVNQAKIENQP